VGAAAHVIWAGQGEDSCDITLRPDDEGDWVVRVEELEGCVAHGRTQAEALERLEEAKTLWIEAELAHGQPVPKPAPAEPLPSGRWLQRVPRSLHKRLAQLAKIEGTSLNQLVTAVLSEYAGSAHGASRSTLQQVIVIGQQPALTTGSWQLTGLSRQDFVDMVPDTLTARVKERSL
jgi:predicted RNase H-like HicB family nuclease